MKNKDKYAKEIIEIACAGETLAINKHTNKPVPCDSLECCDCLLCNDGYEGCVDCSSPLVWCNNEEDIKIEDYIDWSKVKVDTPILVSDDKSFEYPIKCHFAKYEDNKIYAFASGCTSWSANRMFVWNYAKLAEDQIKKGE